MTWPNTTISTDNVDAGSDEPRLARAQIKETIDAVNQMISNGADQGFVELNFDSYKTYAGNTRRRANVTVSYTRGDTIVSKITDNGEVEIQPGVYQVDLPVVTSQAAGAWNWSANTGGFNFNGTTYAIGATGFLPVLEGGTPSGSGGITTIFYANTVISANLNFALAVNNPPLEVVRFTRVA